MDWNTPFPTEDSGTADTWNAEEAQVDTDSESNVYAMWMGIDNMPYFSYSVDDANTWSDAIMIGPSHLMAPGFLSLSLETRTSRFRVHRY